MTGPEHYREAERLLEEFGQEIEVPDEAAAFVVAVMHGAMARAQVHATLAAAAATALSHYSPETGLTDADRRAWYVAASEGPGEKRRQREAEAAELAEFAAEAQAAGTEKS